MKPRSNPRSLQTCASSRVRFCTAIEQGLRAIKEGLFKAHRTHNKRNDQVLRLALNEAEALAVASGFPQLLFPTLAMEKAQSAVAWHRRQQTIQQRSAEIALVA